MALSATLELTASGILSKAGLDLDAPSTQIIIGQNAFPQCLISLTDGTGDEQAQQWWSDIRTVAAGATDGIDLYGALTGPFGNSVQPVTIRAIVLAIVAPANTKRLRVGPQAVANAAQLGFGGVGAQAYLEFDKFQLLERVYTGWAITAGTGDILPVNNPSAVSIDYAAWVLYTGT
jgi:hypothetical protein